MKVRGNMKMKGKRMVKKPASAALVKKPNVLAQKKIKPTQTKKSSTKNIDKIEYDALYGESSDEEEMAMMEGESPLPNADNGSGSSDEFDQDVASDNEDVDLMDGAPLSGEESNDDYDDEGEDEDEEEVDEGKQSSKHKRDLMKLKEKDPELFKFLQSEDPDLLDFQESDIEEDADEGEDDDEQDADMKPSKSRIPKAQKDHTTNRLIFDGNLFAYLQDLLEPEDGKKSSPSFDDVKFAVEAFQACVSRVGAEIEAPNYIINEQGVFDEVVRLCFQSMGDFFRGLMSHAESDEKVDDNNSKGQKKRKMPKRYHPLAKDFLNGVVLFLSEIQTQGAIVSTLKSILRMLDLYSEFHKIVRTLIKALVRVWTRKTLECRVVAFVGLSQLIKSNPEQFAYTFKACYLGFVSNSREVSVDSWPLLQFMHRTFAELTIIHPDVSYPYAFVYIRQTAIHLRNAMISKKRKDLVQTIYNWQLMQCLYLWVRVVSNAHSVSGAEAICELAYPLTQIIIGVSKLYPSPRFLPLRFHCISMLIQLQANCVIYIPTLALACDLLPEMEQILRKKPKISKLTPKVPALDCHLKVNTQQMEEPVWRNTANEHLFRLILQAAHSMCNQPGFPDMALPVIYRLRAFVKSVRSADHARLFRGLIEKMENHSKQAVGLLSLRDMNLSDESSMLATKFAMNNPDAPLRSYYRQWEKVWKMKQDQLLKAHSEGLVESQEKTEKAVPKAVKTNKKAKIENDDDNVQVVQAVALKKKPKKKIGPAASRADATLPDQVADLGAWSDED